MGTAVPIYSAAGALQKLTLDGCSMSVAQATDVLDGLRFHAATVRARPRRRSGFRVLHSKSVFLRRVCMGAQGA